MPYIIQDGKKSMGVVEIENNFIFCCWKIKAQKDQINGRDVVVAVDGSLFRHHPHFHNVLKSRVAQVIILPSPKFFFATPKTGLYIMMRH